MIDYTEQHINAWLQIFTHFPQCTWQRGAPSVMSVCFLLHNQKKKKKSVLQNTSTDKLILHFGRALPPSLRWADAAPQQFQPWAHPPPSRCTEERFKHLFVSTAIQMYSAPCHIGCSLRQPTSRALQPRCLLLSLSIAPDRFSLLLWSALCISNIHPNPTPALTCGGPSCISPSHICVRAKMFLFLSWAVTMCTSCFHAWF